MDASQQLDGPDTPFSLFGIVSAGNAVFGARFAKFASLKLARFDLVAALHSPPVFTEPDPAEQGPAHVQSSQSLRLELSRGQRVAQVRAKMAGWSISGYSAASSYCLVC